MFGVYDQCTVVSARSSGSVNDAFEVCVLGIALPPPQKQYQVCFSVETLYEYVLFNKLQQGWGAEHKLLVNSSRGCDCDKQ